MKRFIQSYLTVATVMILLANLVLIILYGRQFRAADAAICVGTSCDSRSFANDLILTNTVLIGVLFLIWFLLFQVHRFRDRR